MRRQSTTPQSARRKPSTYNEMESSPDQVRKKETTEEPSVAPTFEAELAQIKENGKDIKGKTNRNFYNSIVERIENNVKVLAELRAEHSSLRTRLSELVEAKRKQGRTSDLSGDIHKMQKSVNNLQRQIDNVKHDKEAAINRQKELQVILSSFENGEKYNNPDANQITTLKNKLEKANIKISETKHLMKLYDRIITQFEEQKFSWNTLIHDKQKEIDKQNRDISELNLIKAESQYSKNAAATEYKRTYEEIERNRTQRKNDINQKKEAIKKESLYLHEGLQSEDSRRVRQHQTISSEKSLMRTKQSKANKEKKEEKIRYWQNQLDRINEKFGTTDPDDIKKMMDDRESKQKSLKQQIEDLNTDIENLKDNRDNLQMLVEQKEFTQSHGVGGNRLLVEGTKLHDKKVKELQELKRTIEAFQEHQSAVNAGCLHLLDVMQLVIPTEENPPTDPVEVLKYCTNRYKKVKKILDTGKPEDGNLTPYINKQVLAESRQNQSIDLAYVDSSQRIPKKIIEGYKRNKEVKNEETSRVLTRQQVKMFAAKQAAANGPTIKKPVFK
ncbi:hypothetical protein TVAG_177440 [Trichomonas vaginalis G3]|uniref:Uncharacterized protein n=1 Tax=Trichomonas vaginalis (strain ATCC PRA-98 / G3) TaxID=412133 RepID=A2FMN6_TRIV3|nr:coiled-coil domain-containing protein 151 family [Trichomonas vaginalis G3]EAX93836.1 hypothetical protein TVAG_177440 [Trichomonas vaginalis G3]KAI5490920.1 coiled-coil domain-containing protein 151 family [Trichomonas vaginalis G3]|eukprot:XP_001306766.1 hypothetical protein [Trichomonas vaginalis G3]